MNNFCVLLILIIIVSFFFSFFLCSSKRRNQATYQRWLFQSSAEIRWDLCISWLKWRDPKGHSSVELPAERQRLSIVTWVQFLNWRVLLLLFTNETGPLPLYTFSVMGLSMCSSIFSESSPLRSKSGIINELSGFPNSVPTVRCSVTSSNWHGHTGHAYCIWFVGKH